MLYYSYMSSINTIPRWNLDSIFTGLDSDEYKKALEEYNSRIENIDALLETADRYTKESNDRFDFEAWLVAFLEAWNELIASCHTLQAYAYIIYSTDTTNNAYLNNLSFIEKKSISLYQQEIKFSTQLLAHQKYLESFYARYPQYKEYEFLLNELIEETKHRMSTAEERLASELSTTGGNAWGMLQEQIISNLKDEKGRTFNELRNDAYSSDPLTRKNAWQKEISLLEQNRIALAASLNNLKGQTVTLNGKRHWAKPIERSLKTARLSEASLSALIGAIEDSLPMWRNYFKAKALFLKKTNSTASATAGSAGHEGIAFYDLFAPLKVQNSEQTKEGIISKIWTFEEAKEYVLKEYRSFSEDMYNFAKNAFEKNWIDAEVRQGKVGGAYDEDFPKGHQSRILTNFTGDFGGIITLAHEIGHAYHFYCMKGKPAMFFDYPMTLAETASTFAETIVKQDMIASSSDIEKISIIDLDLQDTSQVLVDILCRYYFEQSVFEERAKGELNADDFCRLMKTAQERSYGSGLNEERHEYMWAVKSHYYSPDFDFYNYPYAFGQLFAAGLYMQSRKVGPSFADTYKELLSNTGNLSCEDLCRKAGFDITKKDFWQSGIAMYQKEVQDFIAYINGSV